MQRHARTVVLALIVAMAAASSLRSMWTDGYAVKPSATRRAKETQRFQARATLQQIAAAQEASQSRVLTRAEARRAGAVFRGAQPTKTKKA